MAANFSYFRFEIERWQKLKKVLRTIGALNRFIQ